MFCEWKFLGQLANGWDCTCLQWRVHSLCHWALVLIYYTFDALCHWLFVFDLGFKDACCLYAVGPSSWSIRSLNVRVTDLDLGGEEMLHACIACLGFVLFLLKVLGQDMHACVSTTLHAFSLQSRAARRSAHLHVPVSALCSILHHLVAVVSVCS